MSHRWQVVADLIRDGIELIEGLLEEGEKEAEQQEEAQPKEEDRARWISTNS